jgi:phosphatidylserine decarboxylase
MGEEPGAPAPPHFQERPVERVVPDAWRFAAVPAGVALLSGGLGWGAAALALLGLAAFVVAFFRNPERRIPGDERTVVAPADGRVIEVGEIEGADGGKALRIGIFLSVFNVHVNRMPLAGRVEAIERIGARYLAAFDRRAEGENVRCSLTLRTSTGERFRVVQITGLIARRIVCHPQVGEWVARGTRYGLIRFGSRTDVVLPPGAEPRVKPGERVRGGSTIIAVLPGGGA